MRSEDVFISDFSFIMADVPVKDLIEFSTNETIGSPFDR
jgi:hypothetical protein